MTRKKFVALLLALVMMISAIPFVLAADTPVYDPTLPCKADNCFRPNCLVHCAECQEIRRLCECEEGFLSGFVFRGTANERRFSGNKEILVNWAALAPTVAENPGINRLYNSEEYVLTEHFIIRWQDAGTWAEFGRPDDPRVPAHMRVDIELIAKEIDEMFEFIRDDMGFTSLNRNIDWDTYRYVVNLHYNPLWGASAGQQTYGGVILAQINMNVGSTRPFLSLDGTRQMWPTFTHELAHMFQGGLRRAGYNGTMGGSHAELHCQHSLWGFYDEWAHFEHHINTYMGSSHFAPFSFPLQVTGPLLFEYWAHKNPHIVGRLSTDMIGGNIANIVPTYRQLMGGMTHEEFNDEVFRASSRFVTFDLDRIRNVNAIFANGYTSSFVNDGESEWFRSARTRTPHSYAFNAVRLQLPQVGNQITVDFQGLDLDEYFTTIPVIEEGSNFNNVSAALHTSTALSRRHLAGWRFGLMAMTSDIDPDTGSFVRVYDDMHAATFAAPTGKATWTVPANTTHLWLVVTGAPTEHYTNSNASLVAGRSLGERWGYQIKLENTALHPDNVEVVFTNTNFTVLDDAIKAAQARDDEALAEALEAALEVRALGREATQAAADKAASDLILAIFALDGVDIAAAVARLSRGSNVSAAAQFALSVTSAADGNLARRTTGNMVNGYIGSGEWGLVPEYIGKLTVSHIQPEQNSLHGIDLMTRNLRDGVVPGHGTVGASHFTSWHTALAVNTGWPNRSALLTNNKLDAHYITMEWDELVEIDGTRILWYNSWLPGVTHGGQGNGSIVPPGQNTFVEYRCIETGEWIRITEMISDQGLGVGTLGNVSATAAGAPTTLANNRRWNGVQFEQILTDGFRINISRARHVGTTTGLGATQWEIFGEVHVCTEGYRIADYNNFVWKLFCAACGEYYADEAMPFTAFNGTSPNQLNPLLSNGNVRLTTLGSGGYGIASGVTLVVPEGRILFVDSILNVRRDATLRIEGKVVVREGGRLNSDGHNTLNGGNIIIGENGVLVNEGYTEIASRSVLTNNGLITNNGTTGNLGRFEVRADVTFAQGLVDGTRALTMHRNVILLP